MRGAAQRVEAAQISSKGASRVATHSDPQGPGIDIASVPQSTTRHVAAGPWHIAFGAVTNGVDFMMVPGTVPGSGETLNNILQIIGHPHEVIANYAIIICTRVVVVTISG